MRNAELIFNLSAVMANAKLAQEKGPVFAVVKNDAYHFGLKYAVRAFYNAGIRHFATTSLRDAIAIRSWYKEAYIFLLNPTTDFDSLREHQIAATLPHYDFVKQYAKYMQGIEWHLEWAGQMRRSGSTSHKELLETLKHALEKDLKVTGMWTHFAFADEFVAKPGDGPSDTASENSDKALLEGGQKDPLFDPYEAEKAAWLEALDLIKGLIPLTYIHAQNSASFAREDGLLEGHSHARLGIYLYGCLPYASCPVPLQHAITLQASVINTMVLSPGQSVGYNNSFVADKACRIAIVNIGYGDGLLRKRMLNQEVLIHKRRYRCVSFMMSHAVILVDNSVDFGDTVTIYSEEIPIHEFTALGLGANSEQISPLNFETLQRQYII